MTWAHTRDAIPRASVKKSVPRKNISASAPYEVAQKRKHILVRMK
jgi:hypothetical protein